MGSDGPATTEYRFEVREQPNVVSAGGAEEAAKVIEARLDGIDGASARADGSTRVVVELPKKQARSLFPLVTQPGRLELYDLWENLLSPSIHGFPIATTERAKFEPMPTGATVLRCGVKQDYCLGGSDIRTPPTIYYYLIRHTPEITGADFDRERTRQDFDTETGKPIVALEFTKAGGEKFRQLTRALAQRGRVFREQLPNRISIDDEYAFRLLGIVVDGVFMAAQPVNFNKYPDGIPPGGGAQISGMGSLEDAKRLAAVLRGGELRVRLTVARGS